MSDEYSKENMIENGVYIGVEVFHVPRSIAEAIVSPTVTSTLTHTVQWLNDNGFELAAQALDDQFYSREDQWWRQDPDQYDQRYMHGEELLAYRDGDVK